MNRFVIFLVWLLVLVVGAVIFDQVMLRVPLRAPVLAESQIFYRDFRARLLALAHARPQPARSIEAVIEQNQTKPSEPAPPPPAALVPKAPKVPKTTAPRPTPAAKPSAPPATAKAVTPPSREIGGYVFADEEGVLHLVAKLEEVPQKFRATAQPLKK